jgi:hypothetical protein
MYYNENDHSYLCSQLIVSLLYIDHTTCFGYTAIFRCVKYKNAKKIVVWSIYNKDDKLLTKVVVIIFRYNTSATGCTNP